MNPKLLLVIVVLLVAVVVAGIVFGARGGLEGCSVRDWAGDRDPTDEKKLRAAEVVGERGPGNGTWSVPGGGTLAVTVLESDDLIRVATLRLADGEELHVKAALDGGGREVPVEFDLFPSDGDKPEQDRREFQVFKGGGKITLTCGGSDPCKVAFPSP